jgi:hypothetical protein
MNKHEQDPPGRRPARPRVGAAGTDGPVGGAARSRERGDVGQDRLDAIEWADDRTRALDPRRGGVDRDPVEDLLDGTESNADYRREAARVTPTLDPEAGGRGEE